MRRGKEARKRVNYKFVLIFYVVHTIFFLAFILAGVNDNKPFVADKTT